MRNEELIEKFILNKLSNKEQLLFDERYKNNPEFKKAADFEADLKKAVRKADEDDFKEMIAGLEAAKQKPESNFTKWLIAAGIALLLGLFYFLSSGSKPDTEALFAKNFEPYRNIMAPIVRSDNTQNLKEKAFELYETRNYDKAALLFTQLYKDTNEPVYLFYKANSLLALGKPEAAIPLFEQHLEANDFLYDKSTWYLALSYLKSGDTDKALQYFEKVLQNNTYKVKEARKLIKELS